MDWEDLKTVLAVHRHGTLSGASRDLDVSHSTVLRRLQAMEERLGVKIFDKRREGLRATPAGQEMAEIGERFETDVDGLERRLVGQDLRPSGCVRVTTTDTLAAYLLGPILADFALAYPDIEIELVESQANLNLTKRDADIAVRPTSKPQQTLVGRRIGAMSLAVYGAVDYLDRVGRDVMAPDQIWCGFDESMGHTDIARHYTRYLGDKAPRLRANTVLGLLSYLKAGAGIGIVPCFAADQEPDLERLTEPENPTTIEIWLLTHRDLRSAARIQVFMEFVGSALKRTRDLLDGTRPRLPSV